jgi:hypothetical protein
MQDSALGSFLALGVIAGSCALFAAISSIIKSKQITKNKIEQFKSGKLNIDKFSILEYSLNPLVRAYVQIYIFEKEKNAKAKEEDDDLDREIAKLKAMSIDEELANMVANRDVEEKGKY